MEKNFSNMFKFMNCCDKDFCNKETQKREELDFVKIKSLKSRNGGMNPNHHTV